MSLIIQDMHRFDDDARMVFHYAREEAIRLGHPRIAPEHLLLGVMHIEHPSTKSLTEYGLSLGRGRLRLEELVGKRDQTNNTPDITEAAVQCMESAASEARRLQAVQISVAHVLLGVIRQAEISARQMTGGLVVSQILGELEGGLRGVMRRVLESLRNTPAETPRIEAPNLVPKVTLSVVLEPAVHQKILEFAHTQGISPEAVLQKILSDWAKR